MPGVYRQIKTLAPTPAALSSPPWSAPLLAVLHRTPAAALHLPQVGPNFATLLWVHKGEALGGGSGMVGWMDGCIFNSPHSLISR